MRISDWSSDVCSSDLRKPGDRAAAAVVEDEDVGHGVRRGVQWRTLSQVACPPASLPLRKTGAKAGIEVFRDEPRTQPLSCAAGEGGAQRRLRADFSRQPGTPSPQPRSEERRAGKECGRTGK